MKRIGKIILLVLCSLILTGCSLTKVDESLTMKAPKNNNLSISGVWNINSYSVKDKNISTDEQIEEIKGNPLIVRERSIDIGNKTFKGVKYKLKIVNKDYMITYSEKFTIQDLGIEDNETEVFSIMYQNSLLGEIICTSDKNVYFYYNGVLYTIIFKEDAKEDDLEPIDSEKEKEKVQESKQDLEEGVYIGLKTPRSTEDGKEEYRTLWVSTKDGDLQDVKERDNIIFPRTKGIWELKQNVIKDTKKNISYEYFDASPIDNKSYELTIGNKFNSSTMLEGEQVKRSLNFVGNDYIATEVTRNGKFTPSPSYEVLPIDNLYAEKPIVIGDIYPKETNKIYEKSYNNAYDGLDNSKKEKLSKFKDYKNFTVTRSSGKWILMGRISPISNGEKPYDYVLNITPNKKLINYDTLIIPWKVLKGDIPFIVDAFISPEGKLAIIVVKDELLIYNVNNGTLGSSPLRKIPLKENEEVIMSEWCAGDYVDKWGSIFKDSKVLE